MKGLRCIYEFFFVCGPNTIHVDCTENCAVIYCTFELAEFLDKPIFFFQYFVRNSCLNFIFLEESGSYYVCTLLLF
jgi:hypothetical protein